MRDCPTSREERDLEILQHMLNLEEQEQTYQSSSRHSSPLNELRTSPFKIMNGRDGTNLFLPLDSKICGQVGHVKPNVGQFLTRQQANYIYKKVETGEIINTDTIQQEIEQEQLNIIDDTNSKTNPYQELIINNAERIDPLVTQMEQWSILSNILNYVQHDKYYI